MEPSYPPKTKSKQHLAAAKGNSSRSDKVPNPGPNAIEPQAQAPQPYYGWSLRRTTPYQRVNMLIMAVICFVTAIYAIFAGLQWVILRETAQSTQRASVFLKDIDVIKVHGRKTKEVIAWNFIFKWENNGNTPAKNMVSYVSFVVREDPLPEDFKFSESGEKKYIPIDLGPHALITTAPLSVPIEKITAVRKNSMHLYLYGWVKYRDIMKNTPDHITRFCYEVMEIYGDPTDPNTKAEAALNVHPKHNYYD